jgi:hypothetical protein
VEIAHESGFVPLSSPCVYILPFRLPISLMLSFVSHFPPFLFPFLVFLPEVSSPDSPLRPLPKEGGGDIPPSANKIECLLGTVGRVLVFCLSLIDDRNVIF